TVIVEKDGYETKNVSVNMSNTKSITIRLGRMGDKKLTYLHEGLNLITPPGDVCAPAWSAQDMAMDIEARTSLYVVEVYKYKPGVGWQPYLHRDGNTLKLLQIFDFTLDNAHSYMLRLAAKDSTDTVWECYLPWLNKSTPVTLYHGWNMIGIKYCHNYTNASDIASENPNIDRVCRYNVDYWETYPPMDFSLLEIIAPGPPKGNYSRNANANGLYIRYMGYGQQTLNP
ncbi:MAG: hypothetical protein DRN20_02925, partial [Thermoplasmata archaeon]